MIEYHLWSMAPKPRNEAHEVYVWPFRLVNDAKQVTWGREIVRRESQPGIGRLPYAIMIRAPNNQLPSNVPVEVTYVLWTFTRNLAYLPDRTDRSRAQAYDRHGFGTG